MSKIGFIKVVVFMIPDADVLGIDHIRYSICVNVLTISIHKKFKCFLFVREVNLTSYKYTTVTLTQLVYIYFSVTYITE